MERSPFLGCQLRTISDVKFVFTYLHISAKILTEKSDCLLFPASVVSLWQISWYLALSPIF